ncbi:hypothetical protein KKB55_05835 [Myxococcota bacterium]|nr:hypothetical protein [Myxococcota bacterium]MBU1897271.1 hypothetical protein [Myxococcota bacterium]
MVHLIWKKTCSTTRRFKQQLDAWGVVYTAREINAAPLSAEEVEALIGERPVRAFLNHHSPIYRAQGLKDRALDRAEAARRIAEANNLLRRPILIVDEDYIIGNDLEGAARLLGVAR